MFRSPHNHPGRRAGRVSSGAVCDDRIAELEERAGHRAELMALVSSALTGYLAIAPDTTKMPPWLRDALTQLCRDLEAGAALIEPDDLAELVRNLTDRLFS